MRRRRTFFEGVPESRRVVPAVVVPDPSGGKPHVWWVDAQGTGWTCTCPACGSSTRVPRSAHRPMYVRCVGEGIDGERCGRWIPTP